MSFGDTDAYKWIEAVLIAQITAKQSYIPEADELIEIIGQGQQPDGYLNTYFTVCHPELSLEEPHRGPRALQRRPSHQRPPLPTIITRPASAACSTLPRSLQTLSAKPSATARAASRLSRPSEIELAS